MARPATKNDNDQRRHAAVLRENRALRQRLAEAEQTLEAIRSGAVDALVISGPTGHQVFTLQGAERPYRVLVEALSAGTLTLTPEGTILYANGHLAEMLQLPLEQILGQAVTGFVLPGDRESLRKLLKDSETKAAAGEMGLLRAKGTTLPVQLALHRVVGPDLQAICVVATDLTEQKGVEEQIRRMNTALESRVAERTAALRRAVAALEDSNVRLEEANAELSEEVREREQAEGQLRTALKEKEAALATNETLLREVHHRVKNNLQMLCDLMFLQMQGMPDRDQHPDLQDAYGRIYAIARLHEQLYRSMQSGRIVLAECLGRLAGGFEDLFPQASVKVDATSDGLALDLDRAIHVGLIVNELITNAVKHAFPQGKSGEVCVRLRTTGGRVQLQVRDNGSGLPSNLDLEHATTLGLRTVLLLSRRLEATVEIERSAGTTFTLTFPLHGDAPIEPVG